MEAPEEESWPIEGTAGFDNWRAYLAGESSQGAYEALLYTDAHLTGEVTSGLGPYQFFNLVPIDWGKRTVQPGATVKYSFHLKHTLSKFDKTEQSRYHGGTMVDEITALASLLCGIRMRVGEVTRHFWPTDGPEGKPAWVKTRPNPVLNIGIRGIVLPNIIGMRSIMPIEKMKCFPELKPEIAIALVRTARLYQDALWLAESEPNLSWLMLVSAVETAADIRWRSSNKSKLEILRENEPVFVNYLDNTGIEGLTERIANKFAYLMKSTRKFIDFLIEYIPPPPEKRPYEWAQFDWRNENLEKAFRLIYDYRSRALHDGMPFPAPMCAAPFTFDEWEASAEKPHGGMAIYGDTWLPDDLPMFLHTFEYIARNAINNWWTSCESNPTV